LNQPVLVSTAAVETLRVLADPVRWRIVSLLAREQLCTCHLQGELGAKQTLVSHHLRALRDAGLVEAEPCGRFTYYRLVPGALDGVIADLDALAAADGPPRRPC
jgi:ArsR family transcriptional regulator